MRFSGILVLVLQFLMALPAEAATWRKVGEIADAGVEVYVDDASMSVDHDTVVTGWVKFEYASPRERDGNKLTGYSSQRMVNCEINRYWVTESWGYTGKTAEPVRLYSTAQEWQMPPPGSEAEIAAAALCFEAKSIFSIAFESKTIYQGLIYVWEFVISHIY